MDPKIKAQKLIEEFGKKLAIDCVNEIINSVMTGYFLTDRVLSEFQIKMRDYWQEVKNEIEKL